MKTTSTSNSLTLEEVKAWHVDALKVNCPKRNLKVSGSKAELVARVFAASEMNVPVQLTADELISRTETEKAKLLVVSPNVQLPDPLSLKDNCLREKDGLTSWPLIFLSDITMFLMRDHPGKDVDLQGKPSVSARQAS